MTSPSGYARLRGRNYKTWFAESATVPERYDYLYPVQELEPWFARVRLHTTFDSWWTMHGVRAIMSRIFYYAEGHGLWEEGRRSPASKAKLGKKPVAEAELGS